jgi:plasmid stabilization system protein ParE
MPLRYLTGALNDLRLIHEYIARDNLIAAHRVISALRQQAQTLTQHPQIGKPGQVEGAREQVHGRSRTSSSTASRATRYRYSASFTARVSGRKAFEVLIL